MTIEHVPVVVARDRAGATRAVVLTDRSAEALDMAIGAALPVDGVLCSDAEPAMAKVAALHGIRHEPVNLAKGERVRDKTWHIQNANAHHSRLKKWVRSFNSLPRARTGGIATRYLPNYLAWHHTLERGSAPADPKTWIQIALNNKRELSEPDRSTVIMSHAVLDQDAETVMTWKVTHIYARRLAESSAGQP